MSADATSENYVESINDACMRIFEACSFQDITGQRITKVVSTLTYIEERLHGLQDAWGTGLGAPSGDTTIYTEDENQIVKKCDPTGSRLVLTTKMELNSITFEPEII